MINFSSKIKILPPEIYIRIAAGEVIERPANVIKELIENSIDAKADKVIIEVISSGKKLIRVIDNGCGMSKEDLLLAVKPHATSKISTFEDIYNLSTLGFRGEALSSIVNVSKTKITSKLKDASSASQIIVHGGEVISVSECAANDGTTVEVKDLFYNTPARLKFLKSDYTEKIHIIRTVEEYAIAYKNIEFKFYSDGELVFSVAKTDKIIDRLKEVFKKDIVDNLINFEYKNKKMKVYGFISPIELAQVNKSFQIFFVNNRPVSSRIISQMLYDAYRDSLPTGRHPIGIIFIQIVPQMIDVNVHPTKRMIKFKDEEYIYETLKNIIRTRLKESLSSTTEFRIRLKDELKKQMQFQPSDGYTENYNVSQKKMDLEDQTSSLKFSLQQESSSQEIQFPSIDEFGTKNKCLESTIGFKNYTYLGQLHKTYLLLETQNGLVLIDQHAASERITFEKFMKMNNISVQKLLFPINVELKISDFEAVKPYIDLINQLGFEITISGKNSLGFYSIPSIFSVSDVKDFINRFIENLISDIKEDTEQISSREKIIRSACRAAIKANDILTLSDVEKLILELSMCEQPFSCPHGRPTMLNLDISYIEKLFLRKK